MPASLQPPDPPDIAGFHPAHLPACDADCLLPVTAAQRDACQRVRQIAFDVFDEIVEHDLLRRDRRHAMAHIRQIAIYVCHTTLSLPQPVVATCFGRDRSTVSMTCQHVEDRRDEKAFDLFVTAVEQAVTPVVDMLQAGEHG